MQNDFVLERWYHLIATVVFYSLFCIYEYICKICILLMWDVVTEGVIPLQTVYTEHVRVVFILAVILLTLRMYITCPVVQILLFLLKEKPRSPSLFCGRNRNKIVCIASPCLFLVFLQNSIQRACLIAPNFAQRDYTIHFENCTFTGGLLFGDGPKTLVWLRSGC